ncbi:hypothetical protein ACFLZW_02495 [Chloroflexota bacterium]
MWSRDGSLAGRFLGGGGVNWDTIILTVAAEPYFTNDWPMLEHENVIFADDLESIHLANVRGGLKLWRLYEALQIL